MATLSEFVWAMAIGSAAALWVRATPRRPAVADLVVGVVGAVLGGRALAPLIGGAPLGTGESGAATFFAVFLGAVMALAASTLLRVRRVASRAPPPPRQA